MTRESGYHPLVPAGRGPHPGPALSPRESELFREIVHHFHRDCPAPPRLTSTDTRPRFGLGARRVAAAGGLLVLMVLATGGGCWLGCLAFASAVPPGMVVAVVVAGILVGLTLLGLGLRDYRRPGAGKR